MMSQKMSTIKGLLERLFAPQAPTRRGVALLLKSDVLSIKLLRPPHVVKWPQGIAPTRSKSPNLEPSRLSQPCQVAGRQTLRLDRPDLIMRQYQASHRGPQHHLDHKRRSELGEGKNQYATSSTDLAKMPRKICVSTWMLGEHRHHLKRTMCQHSLLCMTRSTNSESG